VNRYDEYKIEMRRRRETEAARERAESPRARAETIHIIMKRIAGPLKLIENAPHEDLNQQSWRDLLHDLTQVREKAEEAYDRAREMLEYQSMLKFLPEGRIAEIKKGKEPENP